MTGGYRVIVRDNPWPYNDRKVTRRDNPTRKPKFGIGVERRYSNGTMTVRELLDMGPLVQEVSAPDAYLFDWVTCPFLAEGLQVMAASGFRFITIHAVWVKVYPGLWLLITSGKLLLKVVHLVREGRLSEACDELGALVEETLRRALFKGPGRYSPSNVELVLFGVRGRPWHPKEGWKPRQVILEPQPRKMGKIIHSRKPEVFQDEIDRWLRPHAGEAPFLELFATRHRPDNPPWNCLGHALSGLDIRDELVCLAEYPNILGARDKFREIVKDAA